MIVHVEIPKLQNTLPSSPKLQSMENRTLEEEDQTMLGFTLNTFGIFSNPSGSKNEEPTSEVTKEDIMALNGFRASLRETLLIRESLASISSSKLSNAYEDMYDIEALKNTNFELNIIMGKKTLKNEWLKFKLQQVKEQIRLQKEVEEIIEKMQTLKQLEVTKYQTEVTNQELEKVKGEMEDFSKKHEKFQSLQKDHAQLKEKLVHYENKFIPLVDYEKKLQIQGEGFENKMVQHLKEFEEFKVFTYTEMDKKDKKASQVRNIQNTFIEIGNIVRELLARRALPWVYALWIWEKWHLFKLDMLMISHKEKVDEPSFFSKLFDSSQGDTKNLLVEFCLYSFMFLRFTHLNPNLQIRDIRLRFLCSVIKNEMDREEQRIAFAKLELNHPLTIRGEHSSLEEVNLDMQKL